jgi:nucleoside diphosphate kinase
MSETTPFPAARVLTAECGTVAAPELSRSVAKREYFRADTYYLEGSEQLAEFLAARDGDDDHGGVADFAFRHALLLLKPDAVAARQLLPAIDWLGESGFRIVAAARTRITRTTLRALWHYQWNLATDYRRRLADQFISSSDSLILVVRHEAASEIPASVLLTELKGPTDPGARVPGQLRYKLGRYCYLLNLVHTADEPADVLRELAILLDAGRRAEVCAEALSGLDRQSHARALAEDLHAQMPSRDLTLEPAAERLAAAAEDLADGMLPGPLRAELHTAAAAHPSDPAALRRLVELAWRHDLPFDTWDVTIVGSNVFPMKRGGFAPLLNNVGSDAWRSPGGLDTKDAAPETASRLTDPGDRRWVNELEFSRTLDRVITHRDSIFEVFLTSAVQVDTETFDIGTQVPRHHGFYSDSLATWTAYEPMFFAEAARQCAFVLAHRFLGVPLGRHFIFRDVGLDVIDPALLTVRDTPTAAVVRARLERVLHDREGQPAGFRALYRVFIDGREALTCRTGASWITTERWVALRSAGRAGLSLPPVPERSPQTPRLPENLVDRMNPGNVVISPLSPEPGGGYTASLVVDTGNPTLFDHPLDHIPAMLQLEGLRQLTTAAAGAASGLAPSSLRLLGFTARFTRFGELDLPAECQSARPEVRPSERSGSELDFGCEVRQADHPIVKARVRLGHPLRVGAVASAVDSGDEKPPAR